MDLNEITELEACEKEETDEEDFLKSEALRSILKSDAPMGSFYDYAASKGLDAEAMLQTVCRLDLMVDTGDGWDYSLNTLSPSWVGKYWGEGYKLHDKASVVWLIKQQGYTKADLSRFLHGITDEDQNPLLQEESAFLYSVANAIWNESSALNQLVFLTEATLEDLLLIHSLTRWGRKNKLWYGFLLLDKSITCGLFDACMGSGGGMDIRLDRDQKLPLKYLDDAIPDTLYHNGRMSWSVESVYETTAFWKPGGLKIIHFPKKFRRAMPELGFTPKQIDRLLKKHIEKKPI